jgi:hypothetical protein
VVEEADQTTEPLTPDAVTPDEDPVNALPADTTVA